MKTYKGTQFLNSMTILLFAVTLFFVPTAHAGGESGQCIWYGECKDTAAGKKQNCVYNGPAKPLTNSSALQILQQYCPQLYKGNSTRTCCDANQLVSMEKMMTLPTQLLIRCPSCYQNFLNIYCFLTCDPHQSTSVGVKSQAPSNKGTPSVLSVDYAMTTDFADGMYNSCVNVKTPAPLTDSVITLLCGRSSAKCTAKSFLDYIGSTSNGNTPFEIDFHVQNTAYTRPGMYTLEPMNTPTFSCDQKVDYHEACTYVDCPAIPAPLTPSLPNISVLYPWPDYRIEQVVITRPDNNTIVRHFFPPPAIGSIKFTSLFDNAFLHLMLDLQTMIQNITAMYKGKEVTLNDICYHGNSSDNCVIISILEYWQNNATRLDESHWDEYHFYKIADYLDHLQACTRRPNATNDLTGLNTTCLSTSGVPIDPWLVMKGGMAYPEADTLVTSFIVRNSANADEKGAAEAWEKEYTNFLTNVSSPNMTVKFSTKRPADDVSTFPKPVVTIESERMVGGNTAAATLPFSFITLLTFALCAIIIRK